MSRRFPLGVSFGVMQGRLSAQTLRGYQAFPVDTWKDEFAAAEERRLEHIEWIVDRHALRDNPLLEAPARVAAVASDSGVAVVSVCADIFMDSPVDKMKGESLYLLASIVGGMQEIGAKYLVLPCVDHSSLLEQEALDRLRRSLPEMLDIAEAGGVCISLEADLPPRAMTEILEEFPSPRLGVNYDAGNSACLGYAWLEELAAYGPRISVVHLKDRKFGGASVPLGSGGAELQSILSWIQSDFAGPVTMQAYRDHQGLDVFDRQLDWLADQLEQL